jgi:hypothetical protein
VRELLEAAHGEMIAISRPSVFIVNEGTKRSICQEIVRVPATQIELAVAKWWVELLSGARARWASRLITDARRTFHGAHMSLLTESAHGERPIAVAS